MKLKVIITAKSNSRHPEKCSKKCPWFYQTDGSGSYCCTLFDTNAGYDNNFVPLDESLNRIAKCIAAEIAD